VHRSEWAVSKQKAGLDDRGRHVTPERLKEAGPEIYENSCKRGTGVMVDATNMCSPFDASADFEVDTFVELSEDHLRQALELQELAELFGTNIKALAEDISKADARGWSRVCMHTFDLSLTRVCLVCACVLDVCDLYLAGLCVLGAF
jgi:hypothetical protein